MMIFARGIKDALDVAVQRSRASITQIRRALPSKRQRRPQP
jgi:hypothetical protein